MDECYRQWQNGSRGISRFQESINFDLVTNRILIDKMKIYGIYDEALSWYNTYLTNGKQLVAINNGKSDFKQISFLS